MLTSWVHLLLVFAPFFGQHALELFRLFLAQLLRPIEICFDLLHLPLHVVIDARRTALHFRLERLECALRVQRLLFLRLSNLRKLLLFLPEEQTIFLTLQM